MFRCLLAAALLTSALSAAPAAAQDPSASQAQDLANCAGAVSAASGVLIESVYPSGRPIAVAYGWPAILNTIAERLSREPGLEGATGLVAAQAAHSHWSEQPRDQARQAAEECRVRYSPNITP